MTLGSKVNDIVHVELPHDVLNQFPVTHVPTVESDIGTIQFFLDGRQVAGIGQRIEDNDLDIVTVLVEDIFQKI